MYVEERMYTLQIGKAAEYFKNYEQFGMKVQLKHLPNLVGYYTTEVGELNKVIHLWAHTLQLTGGTMHSFAFLVALSLTAPPAALDADSAFERLKKMLAATK